MNLSGVDIAIVILSVLAVVGLGVISAIQKRRDKSAADEYFLAGKNMPWWIISASLFAANIGSEQFIGMAGTAADSGIAVGLYELSAPYLLIVLGWIFAPLYMKCQLQTTPEYLEKRFNRYCRLVFVSVLILTHVLSTISATLYAGSVLLEVITGLTMWQSAPLIVILTALYTISGGLKAVMLTDTLQTCILLAGGIIGSIKALSLVGGISGLFTKLDTVGLESFAHIIRPSNDRDFPWLGTILALAIGSLRYWCLDQEMAQRVLSASDLTQARMGTAGAALLKILPLFIIILPGTVARLLFEFCKLEPDGKFENWCETDLDQSHENNKAYPLLVLNEFPRGLKGLMLASFLAAMMSSLASLFNSVSALFTYDIYARFLTRSKELSPRELVSVGRWAIAGLVILTFLWIPVIDGIDRSLFVTASLILRHLGPTITAVFVCGVFLTRTNEQGALIGLLFGSIIGVFRLGLYLIFQDSCDNDVHGNHQELSLRNFIFCLNFHYFSVILFSLVVILVLISSSYFPPAPQFKTQGLVVQLPCVKSTPDLEYSALELESVHRNESPVRLDSSNAQNYTVFEMAISKEQELAKSSNNKNRILNTVVPVLVLVLTTSVIYYFR